MKFVSVDPAVNIRRALIISVILHLFATAALAYFGSSPFGAQSFGTDEFGTGQFGEGGDTGPDIEEGDALLMDDGASFLLLDDGTSKLLLSA